MQVVVFELFDDRQDQLPALAGCPKLCIFQSSPTGHRPCRAQGAWNICSWAGNKARQPTVAVVQCVELNHGGPMHVQFAACQFITLPRWHGAVKPIFWGTGACGGTNSSLCTGLKPWLQSGTSGIGEWVWVSVLRSRPFTPCSEGLPDFPGVSASRDGGCCELRAILDFETTRCRGVGRTCKRTSA